MPCNTGTLAILLLSGCAHRRHPDIVAASECGTPEENNKLWKLLFSVSPLHYGRGSCANGLFKCRVLKSQMRHLLKGNTYVLLFSEGHCQFRPLLPCLGGWGVEKEKLTLRV